MFTILPDLLKDVDMIVQCKYVPHVLVCPPNSNVPEPLCCCFLERTIEHDFLTKIAWTGFEKRRQKEASAPL